MNDKTSAFSDSLLSAIPWVIISKLLLFIVYFSISVLTVRYLGTEDYGIYVICKSIAEVLILVCTLGMTGAFMRFIPELILLKNKAGIKRLILKASSLQLIAFIVIGSGLYLSSGMIGSYFSIAFNGALFFTLLLVIFELTKTNVNAILTSLYRARTLTLFSTINGICWITFLYIFLEYDPSVSNALFAPALSYGIIYLIAGLAIYQYLNSLNWKSPTYSLGKKRVLKHSSSIAASMLVRLMMLKYTELFFLGGQHDAETVGMYDLAFSLPMMAIVFIPAAIQDLFVSGFSEAYVKDHNALPRLIRAFYKILILLTVPIATFGFFFAPEFLIFSYGPSLTKVAELCSVFCLIHLLPLISMPLSMGIQAKEKVLNMFPTLLMQLGVNLILDYLFIVQLQWGVWGALCAIFLTFALTIPVRLYVVNKVLGGIYFPGRFFLRIFGISMIIGFSIQYFTHSPNIITLLTLAPFYAIGITIAINLLGLLTDEDTSDLNMISNGKFSTYINFFKERIFKFSLPKPNTKQT